MTKHSPFAIRHSQSGSWGRLVDTNTMLPIRLARGANGWLLISAASQGADQNLLLTLTVGIADIVVTQALAHSALLKSI